MFNFMFWAVLLPSFTHTVIMKPTSAAQKLAAATLLSSGLSTRAVGSRLSLSQPTVSRIFQELELDKENRVGGCPAKVSPGDQHHVGDCILSGQLDNAVQGQEFINSTSPSPIGAQTVRNILKKDGCKAVAKQKKPFLSKVHRQKWLDFALRHKDWTIDDCRRVIWSDESKINRFGSDGRVYVWKCHGEPLSDCLVTPTVKHGGGNIMVWGCMGWEGVGCLVEVEGKMNAQQYVEILEEGLIGTIQDWDLDEEDVIFQQDNDPKHTSKLAKRWFDDHGFKMLIWPPQSPDLNCLETCWAILKRKMNSQERRAKGVHELWELSAEVWQQISTEDIQKLISSMPERCQAVIRAHGGHTKY
jgi:transposase